MEAVLYSGPGAVGMARLPDPEPGPGEVILAPRASGLCHTDVDILAGRYGTGAFPLVPGHEVAGEVVAVGAGVTALRPGDRVALDPNLPCGECRSCRAGRTNSCARLGAYGVTVHGGFAESLVVAEAQVHGIGAMPYARAALAEPLACVLNGIGSLGTEGAENALVFGAGPIGLLIALALRDRGIADVAVCDIDPAKLARADTLGLKTFPAGKVSPERGFDIVAEATGSAAVAAEVTRWMADGGRAMLYSVYDPAATVTFHPHELFRRQLRIGGSHSLNRNIPQALALLGRLGEAADAVISHRVTLAEIPAFIRDKGPAGRLKVMAVA